MKKVIMATLSIIISVFFIMICFTLHGRDYRQTEINHALESSMQNAMEVLLLEDKPASEEEWIAMFIENIAVQIESESELTVNIIEDATDMEKGILSAEAILTFKHPIGTTGTVSSEATIILEEYVAE